MTRVLPTLPTDLTKASTYDLLTYLNTRLAEQAEENLCKACDGRKEWKVVDGYEPCTECDGTGFGNPHYDEKLSDITTELLRRHEEEKA